MWTNLFDYFENQRKSNENNKLEQMTEVVSKLQKRSLFTPDFHKLKLKNDIIVFVYDEFKNHYKENKLLLQSKFLGEARTAHNNFIMKTDPCVVFKANKDYEKQKGIIRGEAYAVDPIVISTMDEYRENGIAFIRERQFIFLLDQEYKVKDGYKRPSVQAFMYLGVPKFWENKSLHLSLSVVPQGDKNKKFYEYMNYARNSPWSYENHNRQLFGRSHMMH